MRYWFQRSRLSRWNVGIIVLLVIFAWLDVIEIKSTTTSTMEHPRTTSHLGVNTHRHDPIALVPGELPGYTGWARSEETLAGSFSITSISNLEPTLSETFSVKVQCKGHEDCSQGTSLFFLRAYGPTLLSGLVENHQKADGKYTMTFQFQDPGMYTVEVVLAFSNPQPFDMFPLATDQSEPGYEGYLLPGFPLQIYVQDPVTKTYSGSSSLPMSHCTFHHLTETSTISALSKARWKVLGKANGPGYESKTLNNNKISEAGYKANINSIGLQMDYDYGPNCTLYSPNDFTKPGRSHPFHQCEEKDLHIIYIGDSVMRLQWNRFEEMTTDISSIKTDYINLYGGYRRCEKFGPSIEDKLNEIYQRRPNAAKAILWNTGLHDIHRLCGQEWTQDRKDYLSVSDTTFSCLQEYESIIRDFAKLIKRIPADLKIFQTSTAAWPKYGNYGIQWNIDGAQLLPLDPSFVIPFNEIAVDVLKAYEDDIQIMDGFWITYPRPDNREIGDVGNKLSHPGLEVQGAMARIWSTLILERICYKD